MRASGLRFQSFFIRIGGFYLSSAPDEGIGPTVSEFFLFELAVLFVERAR